MLNPKQFSQIIRQHFAEVTPEQFKENLLKFCPEILDNQPRTEILDQAQKIKGEEIYALVDL
jgi:hypothetical protein